MSHLRNDEEAFKIHCNRSAVDNISIGSSSDKSDFDEEYYKYKPDPIQFFKSQVIEVNNKTVPIERLNIQSYSAVETNVTQRNKQILVSIISIPKYFLFDKYRVITQKVKWEVNFIRNTININRVLQNFCNQS